MDRDGAPAGSRPIPGMKSGWFFRTADRVILHRARAESPALPIGTVPVVLGRVTHRMADRRHTRISYQLQAEDGGTRIATAEQVLDGTWADMLGRDRPVNADERHAYARILSEDVRQAPEVPAIPVKGADGGLELPDADAQELGYLRTGDPDEQAALAAWRRVLRLAALQDRTTLALGAMFAGPLVACLSGVPAHVLNLQGAGQAGKSSTQKVQAALLGDPGESYALFGTMNSTGLALPELLIQARYLPMAREETSSSAMSLRDLERLFSRIVAGATRTRLGQGGALKATAGAWHSIFVTSSNENLLRPGQVESLASRLIQLQAPFWPGAEQAMEAVETAWQYHGWPLVWARQAGHFTGARVRDWRALHAEITGRLTTATGGIPLTLARILAAWCVGGYMLAEVLGMPEIGERAIEDAHAELPRILGEVTETHQSPGQILWEAVAGAIAQEPAAWVEPRQLTGEQGPASGALYEPMKPRRVLGYLYDGRVYVYVSTLKDVAKSADLDSPVPGLHELKRRGVLRTEERHKLSCKHPLRELRAAVPGRVYVFDPAAAEDAFADRDTPPDVVPDTLAAPADDSAAVAAEQRAQQAAAEGLAVAQDPAEQAGDRSGDVTASRRHDVVIPPMPTTPPPVLYPRPVPVETDAAWAHLVRKASGRTLTATRFGVLGADGLYLPGHAPVAVPLPATVDDVPALMEAYRLRTLYLHADVLPVLGLPEYDPMHEGGPQAGRACSWATPGPALRAMQPETGVSCWMTLTTAGGRRLSVAIPAYEDRFDKEIGKRGGFGGAETPAVLLDALMVWLTSTVHGPADKPKVIPFYLSPNKTGEDFAGGPGRSDVVCEAIRAEQVEPVLQARVMVNPQWCRTPAAPEEQAAYLHRYDKTAAWLAAFGSVKLGVGEPCHATDGAEFDSALAGVWRVAEVPGTGPERLPQFVFTPAPEGGFWLFTPDIDLLREVYPGWEPTVLEAWYWPTSKRALEGMYKLLHGSRVHILRAIDDGRPGARWAKQVNARIYQSFRGYLSRQKPKTDRTTGEVYERDIYWRPDWAKLILSHAMANTYRNLRKFAADGHYPLSLYVDAATYASDQADPEQAKPGAMKLGQAGGCWTAEGTVPMGDVVQQLRDGISAHKAMDRWVKQQEEEGNRG